MCVCCFWVIVATAEFRLDILNEWFSVLLHVKRIWFLGSRKKIADAQDLHFSENEDIHSFRTGAPLVLVLTPKGRQCISHGLHFSSNKQKCDLYSLQPIRALGLRFSSCWVLKKVWSPETRIYVHHCFGSFCLYHVSTSLDFIWCEFMYNSPS